MARVRYNDPEDLPEADREILKRRINLHRALSNSVGGTRAFSGLGQWIRFKAKLDPRLREMAILQVGYLTKNAYEYSHHLKIGRDFGVADDDVVAIETETAGGDSGLPALDRAVLRGTREMTKQTKVSNDTYAV